MVRPENQDLFAQLAETVRLRLDGSDALTASSRNSKIRSFVRRHWAFGLMVVLPTFLATIYFGLIAAPRYVSEAQFVVRSPNSQSDSMERLANVVADSSVVRSVDDAYIVIGYILSRDAMRQLESDAEFRNMFNRPEADFLWRYPEFFWADNEEHRYQHYLRLVAVSYDDTTGICTLDVQAFRPEDAHNIAVALLRQAEDLINAINDRAQRDAIKTAEREVDASKALVNEAQDNITAFRHKELMIDPTRMSQEALETIAALSLEEADTNADLAAILKSSPDSPQVSTKQLRIKALEDQITKERQALAGTDNSMAPLLAEYERLAIQRGFADKTFVSALNMLEAARVDAMRQRVYLDRVSNATVPDYAIYPYRLISIIVIFVLCGALYRIARALVLDALAHADL